MRRELLLTILSKKQLRIVGDMGDVRSGLGIFGYYQKFVKDYSNKARPLTRLTETGVEFAWGEDEEEAWQMLKKGFILDTDAIEFVLCCHSFVSVTPHGWLVDNYPEPSDICPFIPQKPFCTLYYLLRSVHHRAFTQKSVQQ